MILLLLLQVSGAATFNQYLREAQERLGISPAPLAEIDHGSRVAWVPYGPVYARSDFLRRGSRGALRITAYHESCHLYLGTNRRLPLQAETDLQHLMIDGCVEHLLGSDYDSVMSTVPCGPFFPYEVLRYQRKTRKERCLEKR